jgi:hypothetical protein
VAAEAPSLAALRDDSYRRVPDPPALDAVVEDTGRQRLAAYYTYSAMISGVISDDLAPEKWPRVFAEPMQRMGLTRFAVRTTPGLDAQLTSAEQAARRSPGRQSLFAQLLVGLINQGAFGPLCGAADSVRLTGPGQEDDADLELIKGQDVVGTCKVQDHWELVAQHLAGLPVFGTGAAGKPRTTEEKVASQLKETGISHTVSLATTLAVSIHPLGAAAGLGTRLVRARIQTDRDEADSLHDLDDELRALRDEAWSNASARGVAGHDR